MSAAWWSGLIPIVDTHTAAFCDARGRVLSQRQVPATPAGYARAAGLGPGAAGAGQRLAWAIEGTRHYGLGLARYLAGRASRSPRSTAAGISASAGGKSDPIDAVRAARELLARPQPGQLRADGDREALRLLMVTGTTPSSPPRPRGPC